MSELKSIEKYRNGKKVLEGYAQDYRNNAAGVYFSNIVKILGGLVERQKKGVIPEDGFNYELCSIGAYTQNFLNVNPGLSDIVVEALERSGLGFHITGLKRRRETGSENELFH